MPIKIIRNAIFFLLIVNNISYSDELIYNLFFSINSGDIATIKKLLTRGVNPDVMDNNGNTALIIAAREGKDDIMRVLYLAGAKINTRNQFGESAIMLAALNGHSQAVNTLIAIRANTQGNRQGWTALLYAAFSGHSGIVRQLLDNGASPNEATENGMTALMLAAKNGHVEVVKALLEYHADVTIVNEQGATALSLAIERGNTNIAALLDATKSKTDPALK